MMPHNIYVQGSYIDIHDCETVNLSCNGAEVHVDKQPLLASPCETEPAIGIPMPPCPLKMTISTPI